VCTRDLSHTFARKKVECATLGLLLPLSIDNLYPIYVLPPFDPCVRAKFKFSREPVDVVLAVYAHPRVLDAGGDEADELGVVLADAAARVRGREEDAGALAVEVGDGIRQALIPLLNLYLRRPARLGSPPDSLSCQLFKYTCAETLTHHHRRAFASAFLTYASTWWLLKV
jgi:hypothetical protein